MKKAMHTPGPWSIDHDPCFSIDPHSVAISADGHESLAQVVWRMEDEGRSLRCEANARLIAAAPELLEGEK